MFNVFSNAGVIYYFDFLDYFYVPLILQVTYTTRFAIYLYMCLSYLHLDNFLESRQCVTCYCYFPQGTMEHNFLYRADFLNVILLIILVSALDTLLSHPVSSN